jgi:hypothetical protein
MTQVMAHTDRGHPETRSFTRLFTGAPCIEPVCTTMRHYMVHSWSRQGIVGPRCVWHAGMRLLPHADMRRESPSSARLAGPHHARLLLCDVSTSVALQHGPYSVAWPL